MKPGFLLHSPPAAQPPQALESSVHSSIAIVCIAAAAAASKKGGEPRTGRARRRRSAKSEAEVVTGALEVAERAGMLKGRGVTLASVSGYDVGIGENLKQR